MRRIVTGHNSEGKSVITLDGPPARSIGEDVGAVSYTHLTLPTRLMV